MQSISILQKKKGWLFIQPGQLKNPAKPDSFGHGLSFNLTNLCKLQPWILQIYSRIMWLLVIVVRVTEKLGMLVLLASYY